MCDNLQLLKCLCFVTIFVKEGLQKVEIFFCGSQGPIRLKALCRMQNMRCNILPYFWALVDKKRAELDIFF